MASDMETRLRKAGFSEDAIAAFVEAENLPPPSARFQAKMDDQTLTNAVLGRPGPARDAYLEVMTMDYDQFEAEFADVLNANADDDDGTEGAYEPPPGPPADSAAAYADVDARRRG